MNAIRNPFTTGPGQTPPYLAGRTAEQDAFRDLLRQRPIMKNAIITGLRGIGKTVLLESFRSIAIAERWLWVGTDWSESASVSEDTLATRVLADLALQTSITVGRDVKQMDLGFTGSERTIRQPLDFEMLTARYKQTPGLSADKLKAVIEFVWSVMPSAVMPGIVFAYDEAQTLADHAAKEQYPMSVLIETFQSLQRKGLPVLLVLTGLPTLLTKLTQARTYTERMFEVMTLKSLSAPESRDAIVKPTLKPDSFRFLDETVDKIVEMSAGYPYFIQFIGREVFEACIAKIGTGQSTSVPAAEILRKLDNNFFQSRWNRATDRQKELLTIIATLPNCDKEFSVADVVNASKKILPPGKHFKPSNANLMLAALSGHELVYKNRFGRYLLAVPLLSQFILRQSTEGFLRAN